MPRALPRTNLFRVLVSSAVAVVVTVTVLIVVVTIADVDLGDRAQVLVIFYTVAWPTAPTNVVLWPAW